MKLFVFLQSYITATIASIRNEERGATMVEYGLLIAFIAVIALVGVKALGVKVNTLFNGISFT